MKKTKRIMAIAAGLMAAVFLLAACAAPAAQESPSASATAAPTLSGGGEEKPDATKAPDAQGKPDAERTPDTTGRPFGDFTADDLDGNEVTQDIFANGKLNMVNIWATFCGPCLNEMPELAELAGEYKDQGLQVVGVIADAVHPVNGEVQQDEVEKAKNVREQTGADYTHIIPAGDLFPAVSTIMVYPTTIFVDSEGNELGAYLGARSKEDWAAIIDELLAKAPDAASPAPAPAAGAAAEPSESVGTPLSFTEMEGGKEVTRTPFEKFTAKGLDGEDYNEMLLMGDGRVLTFALIWDPSWEGSKEALQNLETYLKNGHTDMNAIGFVQAGDSKEEQQAQRFAQDAGADFVQMEAPGDLSEFYDAQQPVLLAIAPWGYTLAQPFSPLASQQEWESGVQAVLANLYSGCCS